MLAACPSLHDIVFSRLMPYSAVSLWHSISTTYFGSVRLSRSARFVASECTTGTSKTSVRRSLLLCIAVRRVSTAAVA